MKKLVLMLPKMVTWSVWNTRTKTSVLKVRIMRIIFHARKPTSEERKKERKRETRFLLYDSSFNITHFIISSSSLLLVLLLLLSSVMKVSFHHYYGLKCLRQITMKI